MKDITELSVTQSRIYPPDRIPLAALNAGPNSDLLKDRFNFKSAQPDPSLPGGAGLTFTNGVFSTQSGPIIITGLSFDPRRITLRVIGTSAQALEIHERVWEVLRSLVSPQMPFEDQPLTRSDETYCVATLDVDFNDLISPSLTQFFSQRGSTILESSFATVRAINLASLQFTVKYSTKDPGLVDRGITAGIDRPVTFQPRVGTAPEERRFFVSSPTDSDTHLALIEAVEKQLSEHRPVVP